MAYDPNVLRRAVDRLEGERRRRRVELDRLRDRAYGREPRLAQLPPPCAREGTPPRRYGR